jgi:uncharacterized damage-inducible protein DinB
MLRRLLVLIAFASPSSLASQLPPAADPVMLNFASFADAYGSRLVAAFDSIPAERYAYRPTPAQQSIGYIAQHLEDANYSLCSRFTDVKHRWTAKDSLADSVRAQWPKDTLVARLRASLAFCDSALDRTGPLQSAALARNLLLFETDLAEHYSQISSYMRLLGLVPPSALPPRSHTAIDLPASALSPYVGVYQLARGWQLDVTMQHGALFVRSSLGGDPVQLWPESNRDFFLKQSDVQLTFTSDASGAVTGLVLHQFGRDRPAPKVR